ncbi:MAG: hypothetical protein MH825_17355 [Cyanobacteria bacterium]|nr:hypothetical protein [Cyanobacteriota bacterium]
MSSSEPIVLLLQASDLQRQVWQTVLRSQHLRTVIATDLSLGSLRTWLADDCEGQPRLVLFDCTLGDTPPEAVLAACQAVRPPVPAIALVPPNDEDGKLQYWSDRVREAGAADAVPACSREDAITTAIAGIRRVLAVLGGRPLDSEALVASLLTLKRDLQLAPNPSPGVAAAVQSINPLTALTPPPDGPSPGVEEDLDDDPHPRRRYRGQTY